LAQQLLQLLLVSGRYICELQLQPLPRQLTHLQRPLLMLLLCRFCSL
jgi:hypothetical protein